MAGECQRSEGDIFGSLAERIADDSSVAGYLRLIRDGKGRQAASGAQREAFLLIVAMPATPLPVLWGPTPGQNP